MLTEEESAERFEDADENEDGVVSWEEYKNDAYGTEDGETLSVEEESVSMNFHEETREFHPNLRNQRMTPVHTVLTNIGSCPSIYK